MIPIVLSTVLLAQATPESIDADQFTRIMSQAYADVRDVSFVYEGEAVYTPRGMTREAAKANPKVEGWKLFQGGYSFRSDGATRLDYYMTSYRHGDEDAFHQILVILNGQQTHLTQYPTRRNEQPTIRGGGPGTLNRPESPERFVYDWYFQTMIDPRTTIDARVRNYQFLGWEDVDGHRCLKVQFNEVWGLDDSSPDRPVVHFWIDLERGANPLRVEFRHGKGGKMRTFGIELDQVEDGTGGSRWFPVRGRCEYLIDIDSSPYLGMPYCVEDYQVVAGTVKFNQSLPDEFFTVDWKGPYVETSELAKTRSTFRKPTPRYDPVSIQKRLAETLEKADRQTEAYDAVDPDSQAWGRFAQAGLIGAGVAALVGVAAWKIRSRPR
ncbi:MAG: hypothetical protein BGO49_22005 [Planctomycetales bacterium 71-10]|nr:MAG: hypothetical protein BGO49_22005 [Planctomycetales bacterium 71-10]